MAAALMKVGEVAQLLGVTPSTVSDYLDRGDLEGIFLPSGHRRIRRDSVDRLLAGVGPEQDGAA